MLQPARTKYRKQQRGRNKGEATRNNKIAFGDYALVALENGYLTPNQIESARITITRNAKGAVKLWIKIFPDIPYTKKPLETRMGKGKGAVDHYVARIKRGAILYELGGQISESDALEALKQASFKLPIKCRIIKRNILTGV
ncbi:MAG: 50S ribosomal protein L16 [Spirochaetales bacterium]|nr:50S ribosomal protein L16 [Spirochaetales bacterium]